MRLHVLVYCDRLFYPDIGTGIAGGGGRGEYSIANGVAGRGGRGRHCGNEGRGFGDFTFGIIVVIF